MLSESFARLATDTSSALAIPSTVAQDGLALPVSIADRVRSLSRALGSNLVLRQVTLLSELPDRFSKKRAEGKSTKEAFRCLKRHLVRVVFRAQQTPAEPAASSSLS